jgi:hypothetical protein
LGIFTEFYEIFKNDSVVNIEEIEKFFIILSQNNYNETYTNTLKWVKSVVKND